MTLSQSSSSSSLYASPARRFSNASAGIGMYESGDAGNSGRRDRERDNNRRRHEEELINAYEAEEERIINVLSKKLEQLREDKIELENTLEVESENHVNKLSRELSALRRINTELEARLEAEIDNNRRYKEKEREREKRTEKGKEKEKEPRKGKSSSSSSDEQGGGSGSGGSKSWSRKMKGNGNTSGGSGRSSASKLKRPSNGLARIGSSNRSVATTTTATTAATVTATGTTVLDDAAASIGNTPVLPLATAPSISASSSRPQQDPSNPSMFLILDALRRENEQLRNKLVHMEREYGRLKRLNEVYREELIGVRKRLGLPVDNLIGLTVTDRDPFEQPLHMRSWTEKERYTMGASATNGSTTDNMATSYKSKFVGERSTNEGGSTHYQHRTSNTNGHGRPQQFVATSMSVPIPRPLSQIRHRPLATVNVDEHFPGVDVDVDVVGELDDELTMQLQTSPISDSSHVPDTTGSGSRVNNINDSVVLSPSPSTPSSVSSASIPYPFSDSSPVTSSIMRHGGSGGIGIHHLGRGGHYHHGSGGEPASYVSVDTDVTSPPSSGSFAMMNMGMGMAVPYNPHLHGDVNGNGVGMGGFVMGGMGMSAYGVPQRGLSYPSVPPPSLSSSFGSPNVALAEVSLSPVVSRRGSNAGVRSRRGSVNDGNNGRRVVETGSLRRGSVDRDLPIGGRVAETGNLANGRSRAGSLGPNFGGGAQVSLSSPQRAGSSSGTGNVGGGSSGGGPSMLLLREELEDVDETL